MVGKWQARTVSALIVAMLVAGPSVAFFCDALCSDTPYMTAAEAVDAASHHHVSSALGSVDEFEAAAGGSGGHDHNHSAEVATEIFPGSLTQLNGSFGPACCGALGPPRVARTTVRMATDLLSTPQPGMLLSATIFDPLGRDIRGAMRALPPRRSAPAPATLVLRI